MTFVFQILTKKNIVDFVFKFQMEPEFKNMRM